jgi:hypothetical protein
VIVVYKVDRLTRSLADFAKLVETFDAHGVSFVSVTQSFNTTTSMGRLTLNVLLSFAQFEREVAGERIRDKIAASKKKGMWMGGVVPLGYRVEDRALHIVEGHSEIVRSLFRRYLEAGSVVCLKQQLDAEDFRLQSASMAGRSTGGGLFRRGAAAAEPPWRLPWPRLAPSLGSSRGHPLATSRAAYLRPPLRSQRPHTKIEPRCRAIRENGLSASFVGSLDGMDGEYFSEAGH